jgi:hypothetical protein
VTELEIKTSFDIAHEICVNNLDDSKTVEDCQEVKAKRWVSLDSLKALLAEQRKESKKQIDFLMNRDNFNGKSFNSIDWAALVAKECNKIELLVLLEEKIK